MLTCPLPMNSVLVLSPTLVDSMGEKGEGGDGIHEVGGGTG